MAQGGGKERGERERENCYNISVSLASGSRFTSVAACCLFSLPLTTAVNTEFFAHFKYTMMHGRLVHGRSLIESPLRRYRPVFFFFSYHHHIYLHTFYEQHILLCGAYAKWWVWRKREQANLLYGNTSPHCEFTTTHLSSSPASTTVKRALHMCVCEF